MGIFSTHQFPERKYIQKKTDNFLSRHRVAFILGWTVLLTVEILILCLTNWLEVEIGIALGVTGLLLAGVILRPSIKRMIWLMISIIPLLFLINFYSHLNYNPDVSVIHDQHPLILDRQDTLLTMTIKMLSNYLSRKNDWIAIVIALFSLIYAMYTWESQEKTQQNTQRITPTIQKGILLDFFRHSYRNLVIVAAMKYRLEQTGYDKAYPADYHLLKLHTDENSIYPESFVSDEKFCGWMHEFKLVVRNGNLEIDIIKDILKDDIDNDTKVKSIGLITSRINLIIRRTARLIMDIYGQSPEQLAADINSYLESQKKNDDPSKILSDDEVAKMAAENPAVREHRYIQIEKNKTGNPEHWDYNVYCSDLVNVLFPGYNTEDKDTAAPKEDSIEIKL